MSHDKAPIYIVTGATGAIGEAIARLLVARDKCVLLTSRRINKAEQLKNKLRSDNPNAIIYTAELSLDSFNDISLFSAHVKRLNRPIAALINNAGIMCRSKTVTADGYEQSIAVNYLGTALLSTLIAPLIQKGGCITFTTSVTRKLHNLDKSILDPEAPFSQLGSYGKSKLCITHFALYLTEKLKPVCINVNCADPGVVNSNMITMNRWFDPLADIFFRPFISSPKRGASSTMNALFAGKTGMIFKHKRCHGIDKEIEADTAHDEFIEETNRIIEPFVKTDDTGDTLLQTLTHHQ